MDSNLSLKEKVFDLWYNYKKYIILSLCIILVFVIILIISLSNKSRSNGGSSFKDIERIMIINAQNYVKNNNLANNSYISLNNLNIKIDEELNCETLSGVYKENDSYYPYLICKDYKSESINKIDKENESNKKYALLDGENPYIISGGAYIEKGVTDNQNYRISIKNQDVNDGLNIVTYSISDNGKYVGTLKRIVIAEDLVGSYPVLTLIGAKTRTIAKGSKYAETGYDAIDQRDGNITDKVVVEGSVDTSKAGTYKLTYTVTNSQGKSAKEERTIIVNDSEDLKLEISHKLTPETVTEKSVTIKVTVKGNGFKNIVLPDNSESTNNEVSYTVYKNSTYDFVIYDTNNNSEVYSVTVKNIDDGIKGVCTGEYENGYGLAQLTFKLTGGSPKIYKFYSDNKLIQSGKETTYQATNNFTLLINPKVVITNIYGKDTTITCSVKHSNYLTYNSKGYYFSKRASADSNGSVINPYPSNGISYYIHIPNGVTKDDKLPLLVAMHGGFGYGIPCGQYTLSEKGQNTHYIRNALSGGGRLNNISGYDPRAIVIAPSNMTCNWEGSVPSALDIIYAYVKLYNIDFDTIIVTGSSQGGYGTLYMTMLEEHILYRATNNTSISELASHYDGLSGDDIKQYNRNLKHDIYYQDEARTIFNNGSTVMVRPKTENDQRSLFTLVVPVSPAKNESRCGFTPSTIYDSDRDCPSSPPYKLKTPIWLVSSNDEYGKVQMFAQELKAYYNGKIEVRYTVMTKLRSIGLDEHQGTEVVIWGRTSAFEWALRQKYGQVVLNGDPGISKIESEIGANFAGAWQP